MLQFVLFVAVIVQNRIINGKKCFSSNKEKGFVYTFVKQLMNN